MNNGAKKGGEPQSYDTVSRAPRSRASGNCISPKGAGAEHNTAEAYIANPTAADDKQSLARSRRDEGGRYHGHQRSHRFQGNLSPG